MSRSRERARCAAALLHRLAKGLDDRLEPLGLLCAAAALSTDRESGPIDCSSVSRWLTACGRLGATSSMNRNTKAAESRDADEDE